MRNLAALPPVPRVPAVPAAAQWWGINCALTRKPFVVTDLATSFTTQLAFATFADAWDYCHRAYGKGWSEWAAIRPLTPAEARRHDALLAASATYKSVINSAQDKINSAQDNGQGQDTDITSAENGPEGRTFPLLDTLTIYLVGIFSTLLVQGICRMFVAWGGH